MRHLKKTAKLGRTGTHRNMMLANLVCSLIKHKRVQTTLAKAKAARPVAEKLVTLGKSGTLHDRRLAAARLHQQTRSQHATKEAHAKWRASEDVVRILFDEIAPVFKARSGGYTRIMKLHQRIGDSAPLAILEWVELPVTEAPVTATETGTADKKAEGGEAKEKKTKKKKEVAETVKA